MHSTGTMKRTVGVYTRSIHQIIIIQSHDFQQLFSTNAGTLKHNVTIPVRLYVRQYTTDMSEL